MYLPMNSKLDALASLRNAASELDAAQTRLFEFDVDESVRDFEQAKAMELQLPG